ncbi:MAG TPA: DNA primase [Erysipelotrichaceae bacterium]|nr:DNA primase [Erysipelotrichaceae bacterium]
MVTKIENIPQELKELNNWVCWQGADKTPKNPATGKNAQSNNPKTWGTFAQAVKACETFGFDGLGFMFDGKSGYFGVDLDKCIDNTDFCDEFVETLQSYAEISKSQTGIHIICKGKLPDGARRRGGVEMYSSGRYFICTGNIYNPSYTKVNDCTDSIKVLHSKYLPSMVPKAEVRHQVIIDLDDQEIIDKARNCKNGQLFNMLYTGQWEGIYPSQSEADLALCNHLAFWTGRNHAQIDRIFRSSGLYRKKWDTKRGADTYGNMTISRACANCIECYEPHKYEDDTALAIAFFKGGKVGVSDKSVDANEDKVTVYDMTDTGNAHRLYDRFGKVIKYSYNRKKWYFWDGKVWVLDEMGEIKKLADEICEDLKLEAWNIQDEDLQEQALRFANKTAGSKAKEAMIKECQHLNDIPASPEDFDAYTDFLNCQNGIINLRNGELIPHDANFMMSKICNSEYDTKKRKPKLWLSFLKDVTNGDQELMEYIQKCVGYSLSGSNREQCAYFLYGMGNNGKSTFLDTIADLMGGYASNAQPDTLMIQSKLGSSGGGANSDIARLKSARFVTCEEPTEGVRLNEGLLKQLTGGSKVTCRFLYGDEFEYTPEFKIWIATNHKPTVRGTDFGIWRRIKLIPFEVNIPKEKVDKNLKYKLRKEFPQILAWAVEGCMKWQKEGLEEPSCVKEATKEYKQEMDLIAGFIEQCVIIDYTNDEHIMASELFGLYSKWAKSNNEFEMSSKRFFTEVTKKIPDKGRNSKGIFYSKIKLTEYAERLIGRQYRIEDFH